MALNRLVTRYTSKNLFGSTVSSDHEWDPEHWHWNNQKDAFTFGQGLIFAPDGTSVASEQGKNVKFQIWNGVRTNFGVTSGKYCFYVRLVSSIDRTHEHSFCRVGFGQGNTHPGDLGYEATSFGYGSTGKFFHKKKVKNWGPKWNNDGDVVTAFIDFESKSINFAVNDGEPEEAVSFHTKRPLFPTVMLRNKYIESWFGQGAKPYWVPELKEGYEPIADCKNPVENSEIKWKQVDMDFFDNEFQQRMAATEIDENQILESQKYVDKFRKKHKPKYQEHLADTESVFDFLTSGFLISRMMPIEDQLRILMIFQIILGVFDYGTDIIVAVNYLGESEDRIYGILMLSSIFFCAFVSTLTCFSYRNIHPLVFLTCLTGIGGEFQGLYILLFHGFGNMWHELRGSQYMIFRDLEEIEFSLESVLGALVQLHALLNRDIDKVLDPILLGSLALSLISMVLGLVMQKNFHCQNLIRMNARRYLSAYFFVNYLGNGIAISIIFNKKVPITIRFIFIGIYCLIGLCYLYHFRGKRCTYSGIIQGSLNSIAVNSEIWDIFYIGKNLNWPKELFFVVIISRIILNAIIVSIGIAYSFKWRNVILTIFIYLLEAGLAKCVFYDLFKHFKVCYLIKAYKEVKNFTQTQIKRQEKQGVRDFIEDIKSPAAAVLKLKLSIIKKYRKRKIKNWFAPWGVQDFEELDKEFNQFGSTMVSNMYYAQQYYYMLHTERENEDGFQRTAEKIIYLAPKYSTFLSDYAASIQTENAEFAKHLFLLASIYEPGLSAGNNYRQLGLCLEYQLNDYETAEHYFLLGLKSIYEKMPYGGFHVRPTINTLNLCHHNLAQLLMKMEKFERAEHHYVITLGIRPRMAYVLKEFAEMLANNQKDTEYAKLLVRLAIYCAPKEKEYKQFLKDLESSPKSDKKQKKRYKEKTAIDVKAGIFVEDLVIGEGKRDAKKDQTPTNDVPKIDNAGSEDDVQVNISNTQQVVEKSNENSKV